jgi:hypothetical protein
LALTAGCSNAALPTDHREAAALDPSANVTPIADDAVRLQAATTPGSVNEAWTADPAFFFDQGLHKRQAAALVAPTDDTLSNFGPNLARGAKTGTPQRRGATYAEACPDAPGGKCWGHVAPGSGFYNLIGSSGFEPACAFNSGARYFESPGNPNAPCPYYFSWGWDQGPVADLVVNSLPFASATTANIYGGMQVNLFPVSGAYAGMSDSMAPYAKDLRTIEFDIRAQVCIGNARQSPNAFGGILYFASLYNSRTNHSWSFSFALYTWDFRPLSVVGSSPFVSYYRSEYDLQADPKPTGAVADIMMHTLHLDGPAFGLTPPSFKAAKRANGDESRPWIERGGCGANVAQPWQHVRIPLTAIFAQLINRGDVPGLTKEELYGDGTPQNPGARLTGGIINGVEHFSREKTRVQVRDHKIVGAKPAAVWDRYPIPKGLFRLEGLSRIAFYSNGTGGICRYSALSSVGVDTATEIPMVVSYAGAYQKSGPVGFCSNYVDPTYNAQWGIAGARIPAGPFVTREDGMSRVHYSNGVDATCTFREPRVIGVASPREIARVYDFIPEPNVMRYDGFCGG